MIRHKVAPGITGLAQIRGHRGETTTVEQMRERVECDLEYLRRWSLTLDIKILWLTVLRVFNDRKAY
jgi:putative colanic acid biosynthesis UDP-glucose lipid carrier transferase